jgi:hypothetical protein
MVWRWELDAMRRQKWEDHRLLLMSWLKGSGKYRYTDKCRYLYAGGGDKELVCQEMVIAGVQWLEEHPDVDDGGESLNLVLVEASGGRHSESLGTLLMVSTIHARRAVKLGWDAYIRMQEKAGEGERKINMR